MLDIFHNIGGSEITVIAILILVFFGSGKLSEFAQSLRQTKKEINKIKEDLNKPDTAAKDNPVGGDQ